MSKESLRREKITDKNGKRTTVYKKGDDRLTTIPVIRKAPVASATPANRTGRGLDAVAEQIAARADADRPWLKAQPTRADAIVEALGMDGVEEGLDDFVTGSRLRGSAYSVESASVEVRNGKILVTAQMNYDRDGDDRDWVAAELQSRVADEFGEDSPRPNFGRIADEINAAFEATEAESGEAFELNDGVQELQDQAIERVEAALEERGADSDGVRDAVVFSFDRATGSEPVDADEVEQFYNGMVAEWEWAR